MHKSTWSPSAPRASHGDGSYFWNANRKLWTYVREGPRDPATGKRRQIRVTCAHPKAEPASTPHASRPSSKPGSRPR